MISTLSASITGTLSLTLSSANGYEVNLEGFGPGPRIQNKQLATSPWVPRAVPISQVLDGQQKYPLSVWVGGSTASQLSTRLADVVAAMEQVTFVFTAVIDGVTWSWNCYGADTMLGSSGEFDWWDLGAFQQVVHLIVPRDPLPVAGVV
jgi:hypothetical protein